VAPPCPIKSIKDDGFLVACSAFLAFCAYRTILDKPAIRRYNLGHAFGQRGPNGHSNGAHQNRGEV